MDLLKQLQQLPDSWALVAVDAHKRAYQNAWQHNPLTKLQAAAEITAGRAKAIGVIAGPASGGLLFLDHDGISATEQLERLNVPARVLPATVAVTSGRDGRFQCLYHIPPDHWPSLRNRRIFKTGKTDSDGHAENLDLRWNNHYSVVIGAHPNTSGYRWIRGRSPAEHHIANAPLDLIKLLFKTPPPLPAPLLATAALPLLDFITRTSRELIESGGTPGSWNDDQLALALDLVGTEAWLLSQGHQPDLTAAQAFDLHIQAAQQLSPSFDARKARARFDGAHNHNPHPGTPLDKLLSRLAFHTRTRLPVPSRPTPPPHPKPHEPHATTPHPQAFTKPIKLEAQELLAMLRTRAQAGRIRFNTFSQLVEIDSAVLEGSERFYLTLAEEGFKVAKDLALDCLIQIAREHPYDPVRLYLEHVEATIAPTYIESLATAYLRPEDAATNDQPTLYDHMIRCTLIGAVRRVFEPGSKHDTACVLMGEQGARKSSFWSALGGPFFSDSLGDIANKDDIMKLHRSWIMEWAELDNILGRKHAGQIKSFLSQSTDLFRVPYGKATEAFPRRGIIVGSTNRSTGFLQDDTGNRRFWVIPTTRTEADPIDTPRLMHERDAIWAAAVAAYRNGHPNYLPINLAQQVTAENQAYLIDNPWRVPIQAWLQAPANNGKAITTELLLTEAVAKPLERQTRTDQMAVGTILRDLGYSRRRQLIDGVQKWTFQRPDT